MIDCGSDTVTREPAAEDAAHDGQCDRPVTRSSISIRPSIQLERDTAAMLGKPAALFMRAVRMEATKSVSGS